MIPRPPATPGQFIGTSVDVRTILNFRVNESIVSELLPADWVPDENLSGQYAASNLRVTFVAPVAVYNAEGRPRPQVQYVILAVPGRHPGSDTSGLVAVAGLSPSAPGPYGIHQMATSTVELKVQHQAGIALVDESWDFKADSGASIDLRVQFARGAIEREVSRASNYSGVKPGFHRVYCYEQGVDVVMGSGASTGRLMDLSFTATGGLFSRLFDGSETLVSLLSTPWYTREIFVPEA